MSYCPKCGTKIDSGMNFCPSCGSQLGVLNKQNDLSSKTGDFNKTTDTTDKFYDSDMESNKVMGVFAYMSWLVLIPLLAAPNSKFARYHTNQGLVLALAEIICLILRGISTSMFSMMFFGNMLFCRGICTLIDCVFAIVSLICLVLSIMGIVNVASGKTKELPIIGKFKILN